MNFYEHTYITTPELSNEDLNSVRKKIDEIIKKNNSKILKEEDWGLRSLAYQIKKNSKGKYCNLYIEGGNVMPTRRLEARGGLPRVLGRFASPVRGATRKLCFRAGTEPF